MDTKLISEKQFLEIKKELDNIMQEIDKMAGKWVDVGNAISGIGVSVGAATSLLLGAGPIGLAIAGGGLLLGQYKKEEAKRKALENKKAIFYEALPTLQNMARTKQGEVKNYSVLLIK